MPTDLPDYTRMMGVNVLIEEPEVGPVNVARFSDTPPTLEDGDRGPLRVDDAGRLYVVPFSTVAEVDVSSINVGRYQSSPGDITDGSRGPLLIDIKGRPIVIVRQATAEDLQATVTPAEDAEFAVVQDTPGDLQAEATPRPKGGVIAKDSDTTGAAYATIGSHTPAAAVSFELTKILVSCPEDIMYKLRWNGTDISAEVYVTGGIPFTDWFPMDYYAMPGDAAKIFDVQVKYPTGGAAATCHVEIVGEDVGA